MERHVIGLGDRLTRRRRQIEARNKLRARLIARAFRISANSSSSREEMEWAASVLSGSNQARMAAAGLGVITIAFGLVMGASIVRFENEFANISLSGRGLKLKLEPGTEYGSVMGYRAVRLDGVSMKAFINGANDMPLWPTKVSAVAGSDHLIQMLVVSPDRPTELRLVTERRQDDYRGFSTRVTTRAKSVALEVPPEGELKLDGRLVADKGNNVRLDLEPLAEVVVELDSICGTEASACVICDPVKGRMTMTSSVGDAGEASIEFSAFGDLRRRGTLDKTQLEADGTITSVVCRAGAVHANMLGYVRALSIDGKDALPSGLEFLMKNPGVVQSWAAIAFAIGVLAGGVRWLRG